LILNRQKQYALNLPALRAYVQSLKHALQLGRRDFNICFADDREIQGLNAAYLGRQRPTDVISFPWQEASKEASGRSSEREFKGFLGDVVISVETARRNAQREGHSTLNEIRWLILHGVLHLLGYDHEWDQGEMAELELSLREELGISGLRVKRTGKRRARSQHG